MKLWHRRVRYNYLMKVLCAAFSLIEYISDWPRVLDVSANILRQQKSEISIGLNTYKI